MLSLKICWLLLEALFLGFFLRFGSSAGLSLFLLLILIPLLRLVLNLYLRRKITVSLPPESSLAKGKSAEISLKIWNPTVFPVLRIGCKIIAENQLTGQKTRLFLSGWLNRKGETTLSVQAGSRYCGRLKITLCRISLYDCFGLIPLPCKATGSCHITVQPDTFPTEISLLSSPDNRDSSELYSQERPGSDLTETFQIREYVPGDSPRQVHWKLSGKFDRLIVRDPALPVIPSVLVFWERTGDAGDPLATDIQGEVLVSLCTGLLNQSVVFTVGWNDPNADTCVFQEVRDLSDLIALLPRLMAAKGVPAGTSGGELLLQKGDYWGHILYLGNAFSPELSELSRLDHVTKLLYGAPSQENAIFFDGQNYARILSRIEL